MKTFLFGLFLIALTGRTSAEKLCNPVLKIQNRTVTGVTLKWRCSGTRTAFLKGFELYYQTEEMQTAELKADNLTQDEFTLIDLHWEPKYMLFVNAAYANTNTADRSGTVTVQLPKPVPCNPLLKIQNLSADSISLQWNCTNSNPHPIDGYEINYYKIHGNYEGKLESEAVDRNMHAFTMTELSCGSTFRFFISVRRKNYFRDASDEIAVRIGGTQFFPAKEDILKVDENSVTLKLDRWKSSCPVKIFNTILILLPQYKVVNKSSRDPAAKRLVLSDLQPNTEYELHVHTTGDYSGSAAAYTFKTLCIKKVPEVPKKTELLEQRHKYFVVHLEKWECADSFRVDYRKEASPSWTLVSKETKAEQKSLIIQQLSLGTAYDIRITANNSYGSTTMVYRLLQNKENDEHVCGDWISYGTKCIKAFKEAGLLTKIDAQLVCERFKENMDTPSLLTIRNEDDHWIVMNHLVLPGPVWLGMQSNEVEYWDDGSQVRFSRWLNQSVPQKTKQCAAILRGDHYGGTFGRWLRLSCTDWNYVVCEKPKPRTMEKRIEGLVTAVGQLENRLSDIEKENQSLRKDLNTLVKLVASITSHQTHEH